MEIEERKPVVYVPRCAKYQIIEYGCVRYGFTGTNREVIQQVLDELIGKNEHLWPSVELGLVSSWNEAWVFVKYHPTLYRTGWNITAQATSREDLFERCTIAEDRPFLVDTPLVQEEV